MPLPVKPKHFKKPPSLFFTALITLVLIEITLWVSEKYFGLNRFDLLKQVTAESFHMYHNTVAPEVDPPGQYDRLLGWRNFKQNPGAGKNESLNSERWRSTHEFKVEKTKPRVIFIGDSFGYGWFIDDSETIPAYLQSLLGSHYEVMNLSARGFGLDQMALVATEIAPRYQPDILILAFIAGDLPRSCYDFQFELKKPRYFLENGNLKLTGVPVPTPYETYQAHQFIGSKARNIAISWLRRSRLACLVGQIILQKKHRECMEVVNPKLVDSVARGGTKLLVVHLDGELPPKFEKTVRDLPVSYLSLPLLTRTIASTLGLTPERHPDNHPKASLNRVYAEAIYRTLKAAP